MPKGSVRTSITLLSTTRAGRSSRASLRYVRGYHAIICKYKKASSKVPEERGECVKIRASAMR